MIRTIPTPHTPTSFFLPADDLRAAFQCASTEQSRYYLNGVFCTRSELVALDGHQMLQVELPDTVHIGTECDTQEGGFLLHADATDKAWKTRAVGELWVYGDVKTGLLQFVDRREPYNPGEPCIRVGVMEFAVIDGTFPDYHRLIVQGKGECGVVSYDPAVMQKLLKGASVLSTRKGGPAVRIATGATIGDPLLVEFFGLPRLRGTLMPYRWEA